MHFSSPAAQPASLGLAPLIDVVLLLLIFYIVTTSFTEPRLPLDLASADSGVVSDVSELVIEIDDRGGVAIDGQEANAREVEDRLDRAGSRDDEVEIRADREAKHGQVMEVLDQARESGVTRVGLTVSGGSGGSQE